MADRSIAPEISLPGELTVPEARKITTAKGIPILVVEGGTQSVVRIEFIFDAGSRWSDRPLIAHATNDLLDEGTQKRSSAELAEALDFHGAYLQSESGPDWSSITLFSINRFVAESLPLVFELLESPAFPEDEIRTYSRQGKQRLTVSLNKVDVLARRAFLQSLFGSQSAYGKATQPEDYDNLNREQVVHFYNERYVQHLHAVLVAGLPGADVIQSIVHWIESAPFVNTENPGTSFAENPEPAHVHIDKPDAIQSAIRIGRRIFNRKHPDYPAFSVLNTVLGGYFGSRLMTNIREDKGFTYGIGSGLANLHDDGYFFISTEVGKDVCIPAISEIYLELGRLRDDLVDEEELHRVKNYMTGTYQRSLDGPFALADRHKMLYLNSLDANYLSRFFSSIREVQPEDLRRCAREYLQDSMLWQVIAG